MEEDRELKHICKLCNKSFPCGRSLGGHMRSHVINSSETNQENPNKKKLPSFKNSENPKKTSKFQDSNENTFLHEKLCKQCGKGFQSSKALFGHMKCHSQKILERENSWTSQSDNEIGAPNRRKRSSSRRIKRYKATTTTSSSFSINDNGSTSVSEIEQEQEEVALCLIMLSRDVGHWGGLNSVDHFSDNNSEFLEARANILITKIEGKNSICNGGEVVKFKKLRHGKFKSIFLGSENSKSSEFGGFGIHKNGSKVNKSEIAVDGSHGNVKFKKSRLDEEFEKLGDGKFESIALDYENSRSSEFGGLGIPKNGSKVNKSEIPVQGFHGNDEFEFPVELGKNSRKESEIDQAELGYKKKKCLDLFAPQLRVNYSEKVASNSHEKKSKFECGICNKAFHSFQALGGHRASHKKVKGNFDSKINGSENSTKTDQISPHPKMVTGYGEKAEKSEGSKKKKGSHECPICFRVFSSGQALGGHKRSHLIGDGSEAKSSKSAILIQKTVPEIRDFLDLNMPAPVEEESSTNDHDGFKPWWAGGSKHNHKPLVGMLSN